MYFHDYLFLTNIKIYRHIILMRIINMILVFFFLVNYSGGFTMHMKKSGTHNNPTNQMIKKEGFIRYLLSKK